MKSILTAILVSGLVASPAIAQDFQHEEAGTLTRADRNSIKVFSPGVRSVDVIRLFPQRFTGFSGTGNEPWDASQTTLLVNCTTGHTKAASTIYFDTGRFTGDLTGARFLGNVPGGIGIAADSETGQRLKAFVCGG